MLKIYDAAGKILMNGSEEVSVKRPDAMDNRPEIDRILLRAMLLESFAENTMRWVSKLMKIEP